MTRALLATLFLIVIGSRRASGDAVAFYCEDNSSFSSTFVNSPASTDVLLVRSLQSSTFYVVSPGEFATVYYNGYVAGSAFMPSFEATILQSPTTSVWYVHEAVNMLKSANIGGPYTPLTPGNSNPMLTCTYYMRADPNSKFVVTDFGSGDHYSLDTLVTIAVPAPHHIPPDPEFHNTAGYSDFIDFNYAPMEVFDERADVISDSRSDRTGYQTGLRGTYGEAVVPRRAGVVGVGPSASAPLSEIRQCLPNPSRGAVYVSYYLRSASEARVCIYDVAGKLMEIVQDEWQAAGEHMVKWDASSGFRPGTVYFVQLSVNHQPVGSRRMVLIR